MLNLEHTVVKYGTQTHYIALQRKAQAITFMSSSVQERASEVAAAVSLCH